jgi:hypothetical protein
VKKIGFLLPIILMSALLSQFGNSSGFAFDTTPPTLVSATTNINAIPEEGGTIVLTVVVKTSSYDLDQNPLPVVNVNNRPFSCTGSDGLRMTLLSGDARNGTYRCNMVFNSPLRPGIYPLTIFPLTDKGGNTTGFLNPKIDITIGTPTTTPTPTPTPTPKPTPTPTPTPTRNAIVDQTAVIAELNLQIASLKSQVASLDSQLKKSISTAKSSVAKLNKICSSKPKPKGC